MEQITSRQNRICTEIRKLRSSRTYRYSSRKYIADGVKLINEAVKWNAPIDYVVLTQDQDSIVSDSLRKIYVTPEIMEYISSMDSPQGVIAVIGMPEMPAPELKPGTLILDHIQDPGNVGTILRTADAFDIPVLLTDGCADPYNEKTVRASMGAVFRTLPVYCPSAWILEESSRLNLPIAIACMSEKAVDIRSACVSDNLIIIGNEGHGVSEEFFQAAASHFIIPMTGRCESLNAATAATVFMWQQLNENYESQF